jgi:hypothetical protein
MPALKVEISTDALTISTAVSDSRLRQPIGPGLTTGSARLPEQFGFPVEWPLANWNQIICAALHKLIRGDDAIRTTPIASLRHDSSPCCNCSPESTKHRATEYLENQQDIHP